MNRFDLIDWLVGAVARLSGRPASEISLEEPLHIYGLDSEAVVGLTGALSEVLGRPVDPTLFYSYPSVAAAVDGAFSRTSAAAVAAPGLEPGEPIAIVGIGCRFPGAQDKTAFWELLKGGVDPISDTLAERWGLAPGEPREAPSIAIGGALEDIDLFAAQFFKISAEEARRMDPQQRMLLEVSWQAMQDAGRSMAEVRGSRTGVFVGISTNEYARRQLMNFGAVGAYTGSGNALSVAANRLSYVYDLRGASMAIDTACSSSLVAVHLAVRALRERTCDMAMAGGVNLLLEPALSMGLARAGMLSPDGRCKTFDADANGYVRSEGCGVLILKPLSRARQQGDRIYAVITGTAVNQDGRSNGLTAPNPLAQREVILAAHADGGTSPTAVDYVEAHGTGTSLGDPIEVSALRAVLMGEPRNSQLTIGSVKSNVGHLESAAGVAGLIKTALAVHHGIVPANLHFRSANPKIGVSDDLQVAAEPLLLTKPHAERLCGVSSFGFGGANAHVVLRGEPPKVAERQQSLGSMLIPLSAPTETTFASFASRLEKEVDQDASLADIAYTLGARRDEHATRAAIVAADIADLRRQLAAGPVGRVSGAPPKVLWVFSGQGSQRAGMGSKLMSEIMFGSTLRRCDEAVHEFRGWSLINELQSPKADTRLADTQFAQPAIVAWQIAMAAWLRSLGQIPDAVVGHSVGEISAAYAAGVLSLEGAMRLAIERGEAMASERGRGAMLAVAIDSVEAARRAAEAGVDLAAVNGPRQAVFSGSRLVLERMRTASRNAGEAATWLPVEYAFHSAQMAAAAVRLDIEDAALAPGASITPFISSVFAKVTSGETLDLAYWRRNMRETVRFQDALLEAAKLLNEGFHVQEIGATSVLGPAIRETLGRSVSGVGRPRIEAELEREDALAQLGAFYEAGGAVRFDVLSRGAGFVDLPIPQLARQSYWLATEIVKDGNAEGLGEPLPLPAQTGVRAWRRTFSPGDMGALSDHRLYGDIVVPAALQLHLMASAARRFGLGPVVDLFEATFDHPIILGQAAGVVQLVAQSRDDGVDVEVYHETADGPVLCARARAQTANGDISVPPALTDQLAAQFSADAIYSELAARGLDYGPTFRVLERTRIQSNLASASLHARHGAAGDLVSPQVALLDGAFHALAAIAEGSEASGALVPRRARRVRVHLASSDRADVLLRVRLDGGGLSADFLLRTDDGQLLAELEDFEFRPLRRRNKKPLPKGVYAYRDQWSLREEVSLAPNRPRRFIVVSASAAEANALSRELGGREREVRTMLRLPEELRSPAAWKSGIESSFDRTSAPDAIVLLVPENAAGSPSDPVEVAQIGLSAIQGVSSAMVTHTPRLVFVTTGAQEIQGADPPSCPSHAALWGLMRSAHFENPLLRCTSIDVEGLEGAGAARLIAEELLREDTETEIAFRSGKRHVRRIVPAANVAGPVEASWVRRGGAYLVTGATGALGLIAVQRLLALGAGLVWAVSRTPPSPHWRHALGPLGERVCHVAADLGDLQPEALRAVLEGPALVGVIHAAGQLHDGPLLNLQPEDLAAPFRAKVLGWFNLWNAIAPTCKPHWVVFYSSAASKLGSPGQANYSAANAVLDAAAGWLRREGVRSIALNWGPWADGGMAEQSRGVVAGIQLINPEQGANLLEAALTGELGSGLILPFQLRDLAQYYPEGPGFAVFGDLLRDEMANLRNVGFGSQLAHRPTLASAFVAPSSEVEQLIAGMWRRALGLDQVGVNDGFFELGGDSVFANQILIQINSALGVSIEAEEAFQDLTVAGLARLAEAKAIALIEAIDEDEAVRLAEEAQ